MERGMVDFTLSLHSVIPLPRQKQLSRTPPLTQAALNHWDKNAWAGVGRAWGGGAGASACSACLPGAYIASSGRSCCCVCKGGSA